MPNQPRSSNGTNLFLLCALIIWGGLAATPLYLKHVQSTDRKRDMAVADDVEIIRRAVLDIDEQVAAIRDMRAEDDSKPDEELFSRRDLLSKGDSSSLSQTNGILSDTAKRDKDSRGMKRWSEQGAGKIAKSPLNAKSAYGEFPKVAATNDKMLKDADAATNRLRGAGAHLWADRMQALLALAKGQLRRNQAEFNRRQAFRYQDAAVEHAGPLGNLKRNVTIVEAEKPAETLAGVAKQLEANGANLAETQSAGQRLSSEIKSREDRIAQLENTTARARSEMAEMQAGGRPLSEGTYAELSKKARQAEMEAGILLNGTLEGAKVTYTDVDQAAPAYSGGTQQLGVRDLKARWDEIESQRKLLDDAKTRLTQQQATLTETVEKLEAQKAELNKQVEAAAQHIGELLATAEKQNDAAAKAEDDALKSFASAGKFAKSAIGDAKKRTSDAKAAISPGTPGKDDRLQRIVNDVDMEASMHCLAAEIAYQTALVDASRIEAARRSATAKSGIAAATGGEKASAPEDEIEKLRTEAVNQLAEAGKSYDQASSMLGKKAYAWQILVGQAAVSLTKAALLADKPEELSAAREKAYKLLIDAAKGKEQSPLLAPAFDAIAHLQQTAR